MTIKWGDPATNNIAKEVGMGWKECLHKVFAEEEGIVFLLSAAACPHCEIYGVDLVSERAYCEDFPTLLERLAEWRQRFCASRTEVGFEYSHLGFCVR